MRHFNFITALAFALILATSVSAQGKGKGGGGQGGGGGVTIGTPNGPTEYYHFSNNLLLPNNLVIAGPVVIVADRDVNAQNHTITVAPTGKLTMYVEGNLNMHGNGSINNQGRAANLIIYGTKKNGQQDFVVSGGGEFTGVIYAPNAHVMHNGGGNGDGIIGSVVVKNYTKNGSPGGFHFDEALLKLTDSGGGGDFTLTSYVIPENGNKPIDHDGKLNLPNTSYSDFIDGFFQ